MAVYNKNGDPSIVASWKENLMNDVELNTRDDPNYFAYQPEILETQSNVESFMVGSGADIYSHLQRFIEAARFEIILITCFWAPSSSLNMVVTSLRTLSKNVVERGGEKVRVFIGFSSLSVLQKLFQTSSLSGRTYDSTEWPKSLGLPPISDLPGLDIHIKSIFVRPFSVMHPKFVIVDRKTAFLPSCNVSWESWFEGCVSLSGPVVQQLLKFWDHFWARDGTEFGSGEESVIREDQEGRDLGLFDETRSSQYGPAYRVQKFGERLCSINSVLLPSPHHRDPRFRPWPWAEALQPPSTPLNQFLLSMFAAAFSSLYIQTPNLTAAPVLSALLEALLRGVDVHIVTSERLMILEQLVTAGTTTSYCVETLIKRYKKSCVILQRTDEEAVVQPHIGKLKIEYFASRANAQSEEPQQSHLKLLIADEEWVILGSGNMDRASWYTSQELGVAFHSKEMAREVKQVVDDELTGRKKHVFDSTA